MKSLKLLESLTAIIDLYIKAFWLIRRHRSSSHPKLTRKGEAGKDILTLNSQRKENQQKDLHLKNIICDIMKRLIPISVLTLIYLHVVSTHFPFLPYVSPMFNPSLPVAHIVNPYMNPMINPLMRSYPLLNSSPMTRKRPANNKINILRNRGPQTPVKRGDTIGSFRRRNPARESSMISVRNHVVGRPGARTIGRP